MPYLAWIFVIPGIVGIGLLVLSLLFGDHEGHDSGDTALSGAETDHDAGSSGEIYVPRWYSTSVLAGALGAFGVFGLLTQLLFNASFLLALFVATVALFGFGYATLMALRWIAKQQYNTVYSNQLYVGQEGILSLPIPWNGIGEVSFYDMNGIFTKMIARSGTNAPLARNTRVLILEVTPDGAIVAVDPNHELEGLR